MTVPNLQAPFTCVHPYPIGTEDINVIKDPSTNSLSFPVSDNELLSGRKTYKII